MLPRTSNWVATMAKNAEEIGLSTRNKDGDCAQGCLVQDGLQALRILSAESVLSPFTSDVSPPFTEQMEFETETDPGSVAVSPASGMKESPTRQMKVDVEVRLGQEVSETLQPRQDVVEELSVESSLDSPTAAEILEKTCGRDWTPTDRMLPSALTFFSEKENPASSGAGSDMHALQSITRAPMKPARSSLLNQTVKSSLVRRRLNFDG